MRYFWILPILLAYARDVQSEQPDDPTFENRKLSVWIGLLESPDDSLKLQALKAIQAVEPRRSDAVPKMLPLLKHGKSNVRLEAARAIGFCKPSIDAVKPLMECLEQSRDMLLTESLMTAIGEIGPDAHDAVKLINHSDFLSGAAGRIAMRTLARLGDSGIDALVAALHSELFKYDGHERRYCVEALGYGGERAVPALVEVLDDASPEVVHRAIFALGRIGAKAAPAKPKLQEMEKQRTQAHAPILAYALYCIEPGTQKPEEVAERLIEGFNTAGLDGQKDVAAAVATLGKAAVARTAEALRMGRTEMKRGAIEVFRQLGADAGEGLPALIEELQDPDSRVKAETIYCLACMGPAAKAAAPAIEAIIKDGPDELKQGAINALQKIAPDRPPSTEEF
jgi:HEAT repeat protein